MLNWKQAFLAAVIRAGADAAFAAPILTMVDQHMTIYAFDFWKMLLAFFIVGGLRGGLGFLKEMPVPGASPRNPGIDA